MIKYPGRGRRYRCRAPAAYCEEGEMRALRSRRHDEDLERYQARTVDRLRGLASADLDESATEPDLIRARIERLKAELEPEALRPRATA